MPNPESEHRPLQFGHKDLWSLLHIGDLIDVEMSLPDAERTPIELGTLPVMGETQTLSTLTFQSIGHKEYEVRLLTQELDLNGDQPVQPGQHWHDDRLVSWRDATLTVPPDETNSRITIREERYDALIDKVKEPRLNIYQVDPDDPMRAAWFDALSQRILGAVREKILSHKSMAYHSPLFGEIAEFTNAHAAQRLRELRAKPKDTMINLLPVLVGTTPHGTLLFPKIFIVADSVGALSKDHLLSQHAHLYVDPDMLGLSSYESIPNTTPEPDQDEFLLDMRADLMDPAIDRGYLPSQAGDIVDSFGKNARNMDESDRTVLGHISALDIFCDIPRNNDVPKVGDNEPVYQVFGIERTLYDNATVETHASISWQNNLDPAKSANLMLGIFHDHDIADSVLGL
jgi:hypothetical protein